MNADPHWTAYLSALLTPVVALLGIYIAYCQWRLAKNKLKLDLFDRRFKVYVAARDFLRNFMKSGRVQEEDLLNYTLAIKDAKWLLSTEVENYLEKQLRHKAIDMQTLYFQLDGLSSGEEKDGKILETAALSKWFLRQENILDGHFKSFLKLSH